jgi:uncharacterized protein YndB with AHSA1/START domain
MKLSGDREIVITRVFRAPPKLVFEAWTKAEHIRRWWAPKLRGEMMECTSDLRVGGAFRYQMRPKQGPPFAFSGKYLEIDAPNRLVYSMVYEPAAEAGEMRVTVTFEAHGDQTLLTSRELYPSAEVRTIAVETGMEPGMRESMDQLDDLVVTLG